MSDDGFDGDYESFGDDAFDISRLPNDRDINDYLDFTGVDPEEVEHWTEAFDYIPGDATDSQVELWVEFMFDEIANPDFEWEDFWDSYEDFWEWYREHYEGN